VVVADATQRQTHAAVNLAEASAVAVITSADLTNIETGLAVRESLGGRWGEVPVVLRVFDRNLARMMERNFGFHHVRSTSALAAPWFVGAALGLDVLETFYVDQQPFLVGRLSIAPGGGLQGLAMQDLSTRTRVVALQRAGSGELEHPPRRGTRFSGGDRAYLLGPYDELLRVLRRDQSVGRH
jgi:Trk K+ transport system NAD-binding subunit